MYLEKSNLLNKNIILRTDYNVPMDNDVIQSTRRIDASLETLNFIIKKKPSKIIIISHLGRPNGYDSKLSLEPIRNYLQQLLNKKIALLKLEDTDEILDFIKRKLKYVILRRNSEKS